MIIDNELAKATTSGTQKTNQASINVSPAMYKLLSSNIYKDKIGSIVRELTCNGRDAHVDAGRENVPIKICSPTVFDCNFSIRDYGTGMSNKDVMNLYLTYGLSTKNDSNNFIGAMGIGSKSPLAYRDAFNVRSYYQGNLREYIIYMDEGIPNITRLSKKKTTEPDGLEIIIAVDEKDRYDFEYAIQNFASTFDFPLDVEGTIYEKKVITKVNSNYWTIEGLSKGWYASMGGVIYPFDTDTLKVRPFTLSGSFVIPFGIGEVSVTTSREALSLDDKTKLALEKKIEEFNSTYFSDINNEIKKCLTVQDAVLKVQTFGDWRTLSQYLSKFIFQGKSFFEWEKFFQDMNKSLYIRTFTSGSKGGKERRVDNELYNLFSKWSNYDHNSRKSVLLVNDIKKGGVQCAKVINMSRDFSKVYYFTPDNLLEDDYKIFFDNAQKYYGSKVIYTSKLPEKYVVEKEIAVKKDYYKTSGVFVMDNGLHAHNEVKEISKEVEGYYIPMFRNEVILDERHYNMDYIKNLYTLGLFGKSKLFFVRLSSKFKAEKTNLVKIEKDLILDLFNKKYSSKCLRRHAKKLAYSRGDIYLGYEASNKYKDIKGVNHTFNALFHINNEYDTRYDDNETDVLYRIYDTCKHFRLKLKPLKILKNMYADRINKVRSNLKIEATSKYPLLENAKNVDKQHIIDYIKFCDKI